MRRGKVLIKSAEAQAIAALMQSGCREYTKPPETMDDLYRGLGLSLAHNMHARGILVAAAEALEDLNYHEQAGQIRLMLQ